MKASRTVRQSVAASPPSHHRVLLTYLHIYLSMCCPGFLQGNQRVVLLFILGCLILCCCVDATLVWSSSPSFVVAPSYGTFTFVAVSDVDYPDLTALEFQLPVGNSPYALLLLGGIVLPNLTSTSGSWTSSNCTYNNDASLLLCKVSGNGVKLNEQLTFSFVAVTSTVSFYLWYYY